jgi:hypothetical protein
LVAGAAIGERKSIQVRHVAVALDAVDVIEQPAFPELVQRREQPDEGTALQPGKAPGDRRALDDDEGAARAGDHPSAFAFVDRRGGPAWSMRAGPAWHLLTRRAGPTTDGQCKARTCDLLLVRSVRATALSAIERCLVPRRVAGHPRVVSNGQDFPTTNPTTARDAKSRDVTRAQV